MNAPTEKLVTDTKVLVSDIEELLKATAAQTGDKVAAARARMQGALVDARDTVTVRTKEAAQATDRYVRENPWQSVGATAGIAVGVGLLIGLLIGRR
jgi:ElaB/YqjD/DUF883 family membrane-anchored ribosome-binding protein